jgi:hypothetical protein
MPQLDFFTVKAQLFCLLLSIFLIYSLLLKYAMPAYDVFLRLKIKKVVFYRLGVENLMFLSLNFKEKSLQYLQKISEISSNFSVHYTKFLTNKFPVLYLTTVANKKIFSANVGKPLYVSLTNTVRNGSANVNSEREVLTREDLKKIIRL